MASGRERRGKRRAWNAGLAVVSDAPGGITRKVLRGPPPSVGTPGFFGNVPPR